MKAFASFPRSWARPSLWVIVFAVLGFFLPDVFKRCTLPLVWLLGIIMFGMGLTLSIDDFRELLKRPV